MIKHPQYYRFDSLPPNFYKSVDVLIIGDSNEMRAQHIPKYLNRKFTGVILKLSYDLETEKFDINAVKIDDIDKKIIASPLKDLVPDFIEMLHSFNLFDKTILIDTTSIKHPLIFYILKVFKKSIKVKRLFLGYTEPERYAEEESHSVRKFELTEKFIGAGTMPGFLRSYNQSKEKLLCVALGFEGSRFKKAFEELEPSQTKTFVIVGFPSFRPNWQFYVYDQNQSALEQTKAYQNMYRATANSPFGIYNILNEIKSKNADDNLVIAPLGTKPHSIGMGMFAVDNEDVQIYYDFPSYGKKIRTIGIGNAYIYNLTSFIHE